MTTAVIDLTKTELFVNGDPHAEWAWLRRNAPVYWNENHQGGGFWALTRYRDVTASYLDPVTFCSRKGTVMGGSYRSTMDSASGQMLVCSDAPQHRLLRQQVQRWFAPKMLVRVGQQVVEYLRPAIEGMLADGGGDFATDVASQLPAGFLSAVFTLGHAQAHHLLGLTRTMIGFQDREYRKNGADEALTLVAAQVEIFDVLTELLRRRRRSPVDDLASLLLQAEINGRPMTDSEILYNCLNVAVGGAETTPHTAAAGVLALIEHPDQAQRLSEDASLLPTAIEEIFRWTSTNAYVQRTATRDAQIRETHIAAGDTITLWNASANRDEEQFPNANRFDIGRTPNPHIAFGVGTHRCIGTATARQGITLLVEHLRARGARFELAGPIERLRSNFMLGIKHLPVTIAV